MLEIISKLHKVFTKQQRRHYFGLQVLFAITAVIQVAGVASLAPFIALLVQPSTIQQNKITSHVYKLVGCESNAEFLMLFALAIMLFIIISNIVIALTIWLMFHFSAKLGAELQNSVFKSYLSKDFVFYGKNNSSRMMTVITQEIPRYVYMVVQSFLTLSSQVFVATIILFGLIFIDVQLAIIAAGVIGGGYLLVFKLLKQRLTLHGHALWEIGNRKLKLLNESLGGIKEIRLLGSEYGYASKLDQANKDTLRSQALINLSGDLPKFIIETIAFCALLSLALYLLAKHGNSAEVISVLSLYAMAGYKLLPAGQAIYKSASQMKANSSALNEFIDDALHGRTLDISRTSHIPPLKLAGPLKLSRVCYRYPGAPLPALHEVSLTIQQNSIIALVGASGAGKSTLADIVLGMLTPTTGSLKVGDIEITAENTPNWQRNLGYVPQSIFIVDDSVAANIAFGIPPEERDAVKIAHAAKLANIDTFIESLPEKYNYRVGERGALLSGGQRQRIGLARALYHDAEILVLDEATSALDNTTEAEVIATINSLKKSKTIVMIAHRLSTIQAADLVVMMESGRIIAQGSFAALASDNIPFRRMLHLSSEEKPSANME